MRSLLNFLRGSGSRTDQEGFRVLPVGRDELKYIEDDHELLAQAELQSGKPERIIYASTVRKWLPPHDHETISPEKHTEILNRLLDYYRRQKVTCDLA